MSKKSNPAYKVKNIQRKQLICMSRINSINKNKLYVLDKGNSSTPLFKSHKSIERKPIQVIYLNRRKHLNFKRKTTKQ